MKRLLLIIAWGVVVAGVELRADTLIEAGGKTIWRYWDSSTAPAATWRGLNFDDAAWRNGPAPLGCDGRTLRTRIHAGTKAGARPGTAYFRTTFNVTSTSTPHGLYLMGHADDGFVAYLNGTEVARFNLPPGPVNHSTRASAALVTFDQEESYHRFVVPAHLLHAGRNVLAASVHQASANGDDVVFDLALRAPAQSLRIGEARVTSEALEVTRAYLEHHRVEPQQRIPDGYIDGGRGMRLASDGSASARREILLVSRADDAALRRHLDFARSQEIRALDPLARATRLARYVAKELAASEGDKWAVPDSMLLAAEYENSPLRFGQMEKECPSGVCRHRGLLFKLMGDEAGLKVALVRGNLKSPTVSGGHAWNELYLEDGTRRIVDIMNPQPNFRFPATTEPVARMYLSIANAPLYATGTASPDSAATAEEPATGSSAVRVDDTRLIGSWQVVATSDGQTANYEFRFAKVNGRLVGAVISPRSGEAKAKLTTFKNGLLIMEVDRSIETGTQTRVYRGKFTGNSLAGTIGVKGYETQTSVEFKATKAQ